MALTLFDFDFHFPPIPTDFAGDLLYSIYRAVQSVKTRLLEEAHAPTDL